MGNNVWLKLEQSHSVSHSTLSVRHLGRQGTLLGNVNMAGTALYLEFIGVLNDNVTKTGLGRLYDTATGT